MKKALLIIISIIALLFLLDVTILKKINLKSENQTITTYEKIENPESVPLGLKIGDRAPNFSLYQPNGQKLALKDLRGQKVLLNFWATWCGPCKIEMPYMQQFFEEYHNKGYTILGVNVTISEKNRDAVVNFVDDYALEFPILLDQEGGISFQYEVLSYPTSYFIDSDGIIRNKIIGSMSKELIYREMELLP